YFAAAAALMELLGPTETAARLPAYVATLATIGLLVGFARRRWGTDAGWLAGIAYATTLLPLVYARAAIFDSTLTLCTTAAILWLFEERLVIAWAAMAVGALTKGPLAIVLPLMPAFALAAVRNMVTPPGGAGAGRGGRSYPVLAVLLGAALVALTYWLPAPLDLTPAEKAAIPPTALALGVVLFVSAACVV